MKKRMATILLTALLILSLAACGSPVKEPTAPTVEEALAVVLDGAGEDDLFLVCTDDGASEYKEFLEEAKFVSTPVVGLEEPKPIVVVALKDGLHLRVELDVSAAPDVFYDEEMLQGQAIAISAELSPENSDLRVVGVWKEDGMERTALWYADWQDGSRDYTTYITAK